MVEELGNLVSGSTLIISQGPHGRYQNGKSIDIAHLRLVAPTDGSIEKAQIHKYANPNSHLSWFDFTGPGYVMRVVHAYPLRLGSVKKGEVIAVSAWHHFHIAILVGGKWYVILCFMDRDKIVLKGVPGVTPDTYDWNTYPQLSLDLDIMDDFTKYLNSARSDLEFTNKVDAWKWYFASGEKEVFRQLGMWAMVDNYYTKVYEDIVRGKVKSYDWLYQNRNGRSKLIWTKPAIGDTTDTNAIIIDIQQDVNKLLDSKKK